MRLFFLVVICAIFSSAAQIKGIVTDQSNAPLAYVNVYLKDTNVGTTTNADGLFELDVSSLQKKKYTLVFQFLGYSTHREEVALTAQALSLNIILTEETTSLDEVIVNADVNPAIAIVRAAIDKRKENLNAISSYTAQFYSRGLWQVKNAPEKLLGQEIGDLGGGLDSTRTGIIYLSETISDIAYERPNNFREKIKASKVSGDDNGFSFNTAIDANFSFYENTIDINAQMLSPIARNAFANYTYKLEGTFIEDGKIINKIQVIPLRPNDKVFNGVIYIVEDDWQLYGVDLNTDGKTINVPVVNTLNFKQNFKYDADLEIWVKISQVIDFSFGFLGFNGDGRFIANYSDYDFNPDFTKKSFSNEILSFQDNANKKDSLYWQKERPVALTAREKEDYIRKDSLQVIRKSKKYLDSLDARGNRIKLQDPITGYRYRNSYKRYSLSYDGLLSDLHYNTVQGWHGSTGLRYFRWSDDDFQQTFSAFAKANYGFSDDRLRYTFGFSRRFNRVNRARLNFAAGVQTQQFNNQHPITERINDVASLFFERNFLKIYERSFVEVNYSQEIINGLYGFASVAYEERSPLFNTTDQTFFPQEDEVFTSNNTQDPFNETTAEIVQHRIAKVFINARVNFGQKYYNYPTGKFSISNDRFPTLDLTYEGGLGASNEENNFNQFKIRLRQGFNISNKGRFQYNLKAGTFLGNASGISFVDFQHFNGNQTRVGTESAYLNRFNLLPFYARSTNNSYFEGHIEHNFQGWILGKIPLLNNLNFELVAGAHLLSTVDNRPYRELSVGIDNLGWGKFRFLRLDYVRSQGLGKPDGAFIFGLKFLDFL